MLCSMNGWWFFTIYWNQYCTKINLCVAKLIKNSFENYLKVHILAKKFEQNKNLLKFIFFNGYLLWRQNINQYQHIMLIKCQCKR